MCAAIRTLLMQEMEAATISINNRPQTSSVKWMIIENINGIFLKNGVYTVGETYNVDVPEFRITVHSDFYADNYLLHVFIQNLNEGSFSVKVSSETLTKHNIIIGTNNPYFTLPEQQNYNNLPENSYNFLKTFQFTKFDVIQLEADLKIPIELSQMSETKKRNYNIVQNVKLQHTLGSILDDPIYSDFTVESSDGKQFKVHQAVLAANSKVFNAMLKDYSAESQKRNVKLIWNSQDVTTMLEFMYKGSVKAVHLKNAGNLLELANYYDIAGLSILAQRTLCGAISNGNMAIEMIVIGKANNADMVKSAALKYVIENSNIDSDSFKYLNDPDLIKTMFDLNRKFHSECFIRDVI